MEQMLERCAAGLDVAKEELVACVRVPDGGGRRQEIRTYATFTSGLDRLADWLSAEGVVDADVIPSSTSRNSAPG